VFKVASVAGGLLAAGIWKGLLETKE